MANLESKYYFDSVDSESEELRFYKCLVKGLLRKLSVTPDNGFKVVFYPGDMVRAEWDDLVIYRDGERDTTVLKLSNETARITDYANAMRDYFDSVPTPEQLKAAYKQAFGQTL